MPTSPPAVPSTRHRGRWLVGALVVALLAANVALTMSTTPAGAAGTRVGIWAPAVNGGGESFTNQTIRQVVYASSGGTAPRVRLSNLRGTTPLIIGHVDLAEQELGGIAKTGSHHRMTFDGLGTATIPAGQELISDPTDMIVTAGENLLISVYLPGTTGPSTYHPHALGNTYLSNAGNFAADDASKNYPLRRTAWYFLSGLDVASHTATGTLVAFGDSITDGFASTALTNRRYPDYLARRLATQSGVAPQLSIVNSGIAGNAVLRDGDAKSGLSALTRFEHDALDHPNVKAVIFLEGINDITNANPPVTASDLRAAYQTLINQAHAAGVKIYGATVLPFAGSTPYTNAREATRQALNTWIRTSGAFDGVIDFDAALRDPDNPTALLPAYASTDKLHPNDAGMKALANAVDLTILAQYCMRSSERSSRAVRRCR